MKLIDVDETLRLMGYEEEMYQYEENYGYRQAEKFIAKQPTVEAIPIEWIKNWRKREWFDSTLSMEERAVRSMVSRMILEDWEKENEID